MPAPAKPSAPDRETLLRRLHEAEARAAQSEARAAELEVQNTELAQEVVAKDKLVTALTAQIASLTRRLAAARGRPEQLALKFELDAVQRRLDELNRDKFGSKSERRKRPDKSKPPRKKQTGHGPTPQPNLARESQLHLLDKADQICPKCTPARPLKPWEGQSVDAEEITVVERTFKVTVHQRQAYRCGGCGHIDLALGPKRLVPGGRYSPEFATTVAVDKYRDHLPLNRQARRMGELGLVVTRQTLWDQISELYVLMLPIWLALQARILESDLVHADETSWRLMKKGGSKTWWIWALTDGRRVFFLFAPTRGQAAARQLFGDYDGIVMADRYSVYTSLEKARTRTGGQQVVVLTDDNEPTLLSTPDFDLAACWAHGRRGFVKACRHRDVRAIEALDLIDELYAIESEATKLAQEVEDPEARYQLLLATRRRLREERSRDAVKALEEWTRTVATVPGLPLDKAIAWLRNGWTQLTRFLEDPRIPLDNNIAERAVRSPVLGRKTHAGSRSEEGTRVAAVFYSIVESCRLAGVDARAYLIEAAHRTLELPRFSGHFHDPS